MIINKLFYKELDLNTISQDTLATARLQLLDRIILINSLEVNKNVTRSVVAGLLSFHFSTELIYFLIDDKAVSYNDYAQTYDTQLIKMLDRHKIVMHREFIIYHNQLKKARADKANAAAVTIEEVQAFIREKTDWRRDKNEFGYVRFGYRSNWEVCDSGMAGGKSTIMAENITSFFEYQKDLCAQVETNEVIAAKKEQMLVFVMNQKAANDLKVKLSREILSAKNFGHYVGRNADNYCNFKKAEKLQAKGQNVGKLAGHICTEDNRCDYYLQQEDFKNNYKNIIIATHEAMNIFLSAENGMKAKAENPIMIYIDEDPADVWHKQHHYTATELAVLINRAKQANKVGLEAIFRTIFNSIVKMQEDCALEKFVTIEKNELTKMLNISDETWKQAMREADEEGFFGALHFELPSEDVIPHSFSKLIVKYHQIEKNIVYSVNKIDIRLVKNGNDIVFEVGEVTVPGVIQAINDTTTKTKTVLLDGTFSERTKNLLNAAYIVPKTANRKLEYNLDIEMVLVTGLAATNKAINENVQRAAENYAEFLVRHIANEPDEMYGMMIKKKVEDFYLSDEKSTDDVAKLREHIASGKVIVGHWGKDHKQSDDFGKVTRYFTVGYRTNLTAYANKYNQSQVDDARNAINLKNSVNIWKFNGIDSIVRKFVNVNDKYNKQYAEHLENENFQGLERLRLPRENGRSNIKVWAVGDADLFEAKQAHGLLFTKHVKFISKKRAEGLVAGYEAKATKMAEHMSKVATELSDIAQKGQDVKDWVEKFGRERFAKLIEEKGILKRSRVLDYLKMDAFWKLVSNIMSALLGDDKKNIELSFEENFITVFSLIFNAAEERNILFESDKAIA